MAGDVSVRYDDSSPMSDPIDFVTLEIPAKAEYVVLGRLALAGLGVENHA